MKDDPLAIDQRLKKLFFSLKMTKDVLIKGKAIE